MTRVAMIVRMPILGTVIIVRTIVMTMASVFVTVGGGMMVTVVSRIPASSEPSHKNRLMNERIAEPRIAAVATVPAALPCSPRLGPTRHDHCERKQRQENRATEQHWY